VPVSRVLFLSGLAMIAVGIVLAIVVSPLLGLIALVGVGDLLLARMFRSGRIGTSTGGGDPADASVNPYARED
jgi:hypothetical protein